MFLNFTPGCISNEALEVLREEENRLRLKKYKCQFTQLSSVSRGIKKTESSVERLSECGLDSVDESHGFRDAVEGQSTCSVVQVDSDDGGLRTRDESLSVVPPQLSDLLLQLLLKLFNLTQFSSLLGSDLLLHTRASSLHETDQLRVALLTVLHCFISRDVDGLHLLLEQLQVFLSVLDSLVDVESTPLQLSLPLGPFCFS
ncbi:hypothetical protein EYF80_030547 [Liparis tanakae]|uniref:Uncharacterized protein n=1 Tax=Liparis tanakae TaxID=230148 RepID=A0A4Z2H322_9TELE|nr:hypothetical protein EYF80_030547 [Liparis tanakae]